jgi:hypothetical protein
MFEETLGCVVQGTIKLATSVVALGAVPLVPVQLAAVLKSVPTFAQTCQVGVGVGVGVAVCAYAALIARKITRDSCAANASTALIALSARIDRTPHPISAGTEVCTCLNTASK